MAHKIKILVVGSFPTTSIPGQEAQTASGYDEATELLTREDFDYIIIDAVIDTTNGHELLKFIQKSSNTPTMVRHDSHVVTITTPDGDITDWYIPTSLRAFFKFAVFCNRSKENEHDFIRNWIEGEPETHNQRCA